MFWFFKHWFLFWFFMAMKWFQLKIEKYLIQRWGDISCIMHCKAHLFFYRKTTKKNSNEKSLPLTMRSHFKAKKSIGTKNVIFYWNRRFWTKNYFLFQTSIVRKSKTFSKEKRRFWRKKEVFEGKKTLLKEKIHFWTERAFSKKKILYEEKKSVSQKKTTIPSKKSPHNPNQSDKTPSVL